VSRSATGVAIDIEVFLGGGAIVGEQIEDHQMARGFGAVSSGGGGEGFLPRIASGGIAMTIQKFGPGFQRAGRGRGGLGGFLQEVASRGGVPFGFELPGLQFKVGCVRGRGLDS